MATNIIYQLSFKGWPIGSDGQINEDHTDIADFTSLEEANAFIEASGSVGTYNIHYLIVKS
jgi:hypothetical protein